VNVQITLPPMAAPVDQLWHVLLDLGERLTLPWTIVGGQMVLLHAIEHGEAPPQISQDGDVVADIRAQPGALGVVVDELTSLAFELEGISADGIGHRYVRAAEPRPVVVDVLAPEGLGGKVDLTTTPPGRTLEIPGGTQALNRTERVDVIHEGRRGSVPRPGLLAAIVAKAAATGLPNPGRHYRDLLCCARWWRIRSRWPRTSEGRIGSASTGTRLARRQAPRMDSGARTHPVAGTDRVLVARSARLET